MGILKALFGAFTGEQTGKQPQGNYSINISIEAPERAVKRYTEPCERERVYPADLPKFDDIEAEGHNDRRALIYTLIRINTDRAKPFSADELSAQDFGSSKAAYDLLVKKGLAEKLSPAEEIAALMSKDEMKNVLVERGISEKGKKQRLAEKLVESGYKIDRRKYREKLFMLSESGMAEVRRYYADRQRAVERAIAALETLDYSEAISAYRRFDSTWGFAHTSGKRHTIFAHYDISTARFSFFERYPMRELNNTERFKKTLRACLIAGLMRGCQDRWELRNDFESVCEEAINCPRLLSLFDYDREVLAEMRKQAEFDAGNALEYYISHLEYLGRQSER